MINQVWYLNTECTYSELEEKFQNPPDTFSLYSFLFLNSDAVDFAQLVRDLERKGVSAGYIQERGSNQQHFLSGGYFSLLKTAAETARLPFGVCDEAGGMYGGHALCPDMPRGQSLDYTRIEVTGEYTVPPCFFAVFGGTAAGQIQSKTLTLRSAGDTVQGPGRLYCYTLYHDKSASGSEIDYLHPQTAEVIIREIYAPLCKRADALGQRFQSIFMDLEGDFGYKLAWSETVAKTYRERFGEDIRVWMPLLSERDAEGRWTVARWRWYDAVSAVYTDGFFKKIVGYAEEKGLCLTGHLWEESLYNQTLQTGDFYRAMRCFTITGVDSLRMDCRSPRDFKEAQTISQMEKKRYMCEACACANWGLSPADIRRAINCMTAWGVNHIVLHGVYTDRDPAKMGFAPDFYDVNPYWEYFDQIADYAKRASFVNAQGRLAADTVVFYPGDSAWMLMGDMVFDRKQPFTGYISDYRDFDKLEFSALCREIEDSYTRVLEQLAWERVEYFVFDHEYFAEADFAGIENIVVPAVFAMSLKTLERLYQLALAGKRVYFAGRLPEASVENGLRDPALSALLDRLLTLGIVERGLGIHSKVRFLKGGFKLITSHRKVGDRDLFWLANETERAQKAVLLFSGLFYDSVCILDCGTGEKRYIQSRKTAAGTETDLEMEPYEGFWLVLGGTAEPAPAQAYSLLPLPKTWTIRKGDEVLPQRTLADWSDYGLADYTGFLTYETTFQAQPGERLRVDLGDVYYTAEVFVNGQSAGSRLWPPFVFDISPYLRDGENQLAVKIGNLACNGFRKQVEQLRNSPIHMPVEETRFRAGFFPRE